MIGKPTYPLINVLFAREDSIYKTLPGCEVWDIKRDARNYTGDGPVICHPPCRAWGQLRAFAKPRPDEKALALFAIATIRRCGGILEHPRSSQLWPEYLPLPGQTDEFGGYSILIDQFCFGHRARKRTLLYICHINKADLPDIPLRFDAIEAVVGGNSGRRSKPEITRKEREATPLKLAEWLIAAAQKAIKEIEYAA